MLSGQVFGADANDSALVTLDSIPRASFGMPEVPVGSGRWLTNAVGVETSGLAVFRAVG